MTANPSNPRKDTDVPVDTKKVGQGAYKVFIKDDESKRDYALLPIKSIDEMTKVLEFGAAKYAKDNWRLCSDFDRYYSAALRHLFAYKAGEFIDNESGLSHLSHAMCNLSFLVELDDGKNQR
jgi:hypothetical protein